jgi:DNA polymerase III gamma/tau subunit
MTNALLPGKNGRPADAKPAARESLYNRRRPRKLSEVVGQPDAVKEVKKFLDAGDFPHAVLFTGPSGTGKNTLARILSRRLGCHATDYHEINCAEDGALELIRALPNAARIQPLGDCVVYLLDEFQSLSRAGFAQQALLGLLEFPPKTAYFILATTAPQKIIKAIRTRCTTVVLKAVPADDLRGLVLETAKSEGGSVSDKVAAKIAEYACGSPREALVLLEKALGLADEREQLAAVTPEDACPEIVDLCRLLLKNAPLKDCMKVAKAIDGDPEGVRYAVLAYAAKVLGDCGPQAKRAADIVQIFRDDWFTCGLAGLLVSVYEVCGRK